MHKLNIVHPGCGHALFHVFMHLFALIVHCEFLMTPKNVPSAKHIFLRYHLLSTFKVVGQQHSIHPGLSTLHHLHPATPIMCIYMAAWFVVHTHVLRMHFCVPTWVSGSLVKNSLWSPNKQVLCLNLYLWGVCCISKSFPKMVPVLQLLAWSSMNKSGYPLWTLCMLRMSWSLLIYVLLMYTFCSGVRRTRYWINTQNIYLAYCTSCVTILWLSGIQGIESHCWEGKTHPQDKTITRCYYIAKKFQYVTKLWVTNELGNGWVEVRTRCLLHCLPIMRDGISTYWTFKDYWRLLQKFKSFDASMIPRPFYVNVFQLHLISSNYVNFLLVQIIFTLHDGLNFLASRSTHPSWIEGFKW